MSWHGCRMPKMRKKREEARRRSRKPSIHKPSRVYHQSLRSKSRQPNQIDREDPFHPYLKAVATQEAHPAKRLITEDLLSTGQSMSIFHLSNSSRVLWTPSPKCLAKSLKAAQVRLKQRPTWNLLSLSKSTNIFSIPWTSILGKWMSKIKSRAANNKLKLVSN